MHGIHRSFGPSSLPCHTHTQLLLRPAPVHLLTPREAMQRLDKKGKRQTKTAISLGHAFNHKADSAVYASLHFLVTTCALHIFS